MENKLSSFFKILKETLRFILRNPPIYKQIRVKLMGYVFLTILLTVYGQLVIKWQVVAAGVIPEVISDKITFLCKLILNPWVLSGFAAAFAASLSWMLAMSKMQLSYAYPFVSLSFVFVLIFSAILFYEPLTWQKIVGLLFVIIGVSISAKG